MKRRLRLFPLQLWVVLWAFLLPALGQESYRAVEVKGWDLFPPSQLQTLLRVSDSPDQIVWLIHGYDMGVSESTRKYEELARQLRAQLGSRRVEIFGLQWDSGGHSILNPIGDYFQTVERARSVGVGPFRQLLLALQSEHPEVPMSVFAHSMGCEVALAALSPEIDHPEQQPTGPTFEPNEALRLHLAAFVGSDLDYDIWYKSGSAGKTWFERVGLTWLTVSDPTQPGDKVLSLRTRFRGKAAGSLMPRMTEDQLDSVLPARKLVLDDLEIPADHEIDSYFRPARVERLVETLLHLTEGGAPPPELQAIQSVLESPAELTPLRKQLDSPHAGAAFVALWRLEHLLCQSSTHLADRTLEKAVLPLADHPQSIWSQQAQSPCHTLRLALFPTETTMRRAGAPYRSRPERYRPPGRRPSSH